jgi:streptogramin lyase
MAADSSGALYLLWFCSTSGTSPSCLTKLSPEGATVWQDDLGFTASGIAVDPGGSVYIMTLQSYASPPGSPFVEKLSLDGTSVLWQTPLDSSLSPRGAALDSAGHLLNLA